MEVVHARWGSKKYAESCSMTLSNGTEPSTAQLVMGRTFREKYPRSGTLSLCDGKLPPLVFPDCRVREAVNAKSQSGHQWNLTILDRRWRWHLTGDISGEYNRRNTVGDFVFPAEKKSARELSFLLLVAMGELSEGANAETAYASTNWSTTDSIQRMTILKDVGFDVSGMPADAYPHVEWDHNNPSEMLAELCDRYNVRIALACVREPVDMSLKAEQYIFSAVRLHAPGVLSQELPATIEEETETMTMIMEPQKIRIIGGKNKYQLIVPLEAVSMDTDGSIKKLNDLSYAPQNGNWTPKVFEEHLGGEKTSDPSMTLFRWYRPISDEITIHMPDGAEDILISRKRLTDTWSDELVEAISSNGEARRDKAFAFGYHMTDESMIDESHRSSTPYAVIKSSLRLNMEYGVVEFSNRVFDALNGAMVGATIYLCCSCALDRFVHDDTSNTDGIEETLELIRRDDVFREYLINPNTFQASEQNKENIDEKISQYITEHMRQYDAWEVDNELSAFTRTHAGIPSVATDGAVEQVTFQIDSRNAPMTTISIGTEHSREVPRSRLRQVYRRQRREDQRMMTTERTDL